MSFFAGIWKDPKTTIIGLAVIGVTVALTLGKCTFTDWKEFILVAIGLIAGVGSLLTNTKKEN